MKNTDRSYDIGWEEFARKLKASKENSQAEVFKLILNLPELGKRNKTSVLELCNKLKNFDDGNIKNFGEKIELKTLLTKRELEIVKYVSQGFNNEEIAKILMVSRHTVKAHVVSILSKTEQKNRIQLAYHIGKIGLFET